MTWLNIMFTPKKDIEAKIKLSKEQEKREKSELSYWLKEGNNEM